MVLLAGLAGLAGLAVWPRYPGRSQICVPSEYECLRTGSAPSRPSNLERVFRLTKLDSKGEILRSRALSKTSSHFVLVVASLWFGGDDKIGG